jgi:deoxyadenosine/deoxycytidine kinase
MYKSNSNVIVLAGTCASGKSSTAETFMRQYGFDVIYFYDELSAFEHVSNEDIIIFDNSTYSLEESADKILQMYNKSLHV